MNYATRYVNSYAFLDVNDMYLHDRVEAVVMMGALDKIKKVKDKVASDGTDQVRSVSGRAVGAMGGRISDFGKHVAGDESVKTAVAPTEDDVHEFGKIIATNAGSGANHVVHHAKLDATKEVSKIRSTLRSGEEVAIIGRQSRGIVKAGSSTINPKTMFLTNLRIIIRQPKRLGMGENMEEYYYDMIKNARLEKGMRASSIILTIEGQTELSKLGGFGSTATRITSGDGVGEIGGLDRELAVEMHQYINNRLEEIRLEKRGQQQQQQSPQLTPPQSPQDPMNLLKIRLVSGEIDEAEYKRLKDLLGD